MTVSQTLATCPERTATAAELAAERARTGHQVDNVNLKAGSGAELAADPARPSRQSPRTLHALCVQSAAVVPCPQCWAPGGTPCSRGASGLGYHVARFARARRRGLLAEAELATVLGGLDAFTNATIVRDGAR